MNNTIEAALLRLQKEQEDQKQVITFRKDQIYEALAEVYRNGDIVARKERGKKRGDIIKVIEEVDENTAKAENLTRKSTILIRKKDIIQGTLKEIKRKIIHILEEQYENDRAGI